MIKLFNKNLIFINAILFLIVLFLILGIVKAKKLEVLKKSEEIKNSINLLENRNLLKNYSFKNSTSLVSYFYKLISKYNFQARQLDFQKEDENFSIVSVEIKMDYLNIFDFLSDILNSEKYLDIKEFSLNGIREDLSILLKMKVEAMIDE